MSDLTRQTFRDTVHVIADGDHCRAGAVIAMSGALAAALARATANGSIEEGARGGALEAARDMQARMQAAHEAFVRLADDDARAIGQFVELRKAGRALQGYAVLCDGPREMARTAVDACAAMQAYRDWVCERTHDDLEFALSLMVSASRAAVLLLDSNLRIWPLPDLLREFDPDVQQLSREIAALSPRGRIRQP